MNIQEITKKYLEGKTLEEFAKDLGIDASRQMVWFWKEGKYSPSMITLFRVLGSSTSADWAKTWADECLAVLKDSINVTEEIM